MKLKTFLLLVAIATLLAPRGRAAEPEFKPLFNGQDPTGWDGNPALWSVEDGCITGKTAGPETLACNQFLLWRGGVVKNFELRAKVKQSGNNTGIQYRSKELPEVGKWSVGGYQCDIHPAPANNAMLYEEKGRGVLTRNGQSVVIDPEGRRWVVAEREPVKVDVAEWHEYTVIAQGNRLVHKLDGRVTAELVDHEEARRSLAGLLAFQIHRGPAMKVQIKDVLLKELPDGGVVAFDQAALPANAAPAEKAKGAPRGKAKQSPKADAPKPSAPAPSAPKAEATPATTPRSNSPTSRAANLRPCPSCPRACSTA